MIDKIAVSYSLSFGQPLYPVPVGASVTVTDKTTNSSAAIYTNTTGTAKANPFVTDALGEINFFADAGKYDIAVTSAEGSVTWEDVEVVGWKKPWIPTSGSTVLLDDTMHDQNLKLTEDAAVAVQIDDSFPLSEGTDIHIFRDAGLTGSVTIVGLNGQNVYPMNGALAEIEGRGCATISCDENGDVWVYGSLKSS